MGVPWPRCSSEKTVASICTLHMQRRFEQEGLEWLHRQDRHLYHRTAGPGGRNRAVRPDLSSSSSDTSSTMPELVDIDSDTVAPAFENLD